MRLGCGAYKSAELGILTEVALILQMPVRPISFVVFVEVPIENVEPHHAPVVI
jgi:hypothetical protein